MPDKYPSMTALYADPSNIEGITYGKRWKRHEWSQLAEAQSTDNTEIQKTVIAVHSAGIRRRRGRLWRGGISSTLVWIAGFHDMGFFGP